MKLLTEFRSAAVFYLMSLVERKHELNQQTL